MSYTIVQHVANDGFNANPSVTVTATTAGNLLVAFIGTSNGAGSNTFTALPTGWTQIGTTQVNSVWIGVTGGLFYLANCPGGTTSFTWTINASPSEWDIMFLEIGGAATSSPLDVSNVSNVAALHTSDSVSTTTTANGDIILGLGIWDVTPASTSAYNDGVGYTLIQTHSDANGWETVRAAYQVQTTAGAITYAPSWTGSVDDILWIVAFKVAGGLSFGFTETLTPSDSITKLDSYIPTDSLTVADVPGVAQWQYDSLTASDTSAYQQSLVPVEAPPFSEVLLKLDSYSVTDSLPLTEQLLSSVPINSNPMGGTESLVASDSVFGVNGSTLIEANTASDVGSSQRGQIETLTTADSILKTDTALPIDALSLPDTSTDNEQALLGSDNALSVTDSLTSSALTNNLMLFTDALPLSEVLLKTDSYSQTEALPLTQTILIGTPTITNQMSFVDALVVSDVPSAAQWQYDTLTATDSQLDMDSVFISLSLLESDTITIYEGDTFVENVLITETETSVATYLPNSFTSLLVSSSLMAARQESAFETDAVSSSILANEGDAFFETDIVTSTLLSPASFSTMAATEIISISESLFSSSTVITTDTSLPLGDGITKTDIFLSIDTPIISTSISGANTNLTPFSESLILSETMTKIDTYQPAEVQGLVESLLANDATTKWVDLLSVGDVLLWQMSVPVSVGTTSALAYGRDGIVSAFGRDGIVQAIRI